MSKGSRPRPYSVSQDEFANKFDSIFGNKPKKEPYVPPPLPEQVQDEPKIQWGNISDSQSKD